MTFKTIEEREREAYTTGHVAMADLIAERAEAQDELDYLQDVIDDVKAERDHAQSDLSDLQYDCDSLKDKLEQAKERIAELEAELAAK